MKICLFLFTYLVFTIAFSEEKLGTVEVIGISPLPGIFIEKKTTQAHLNLLMKMK